MMMVSYAGNEDDGYGDDCNDMIMMMAIKIIR